MRRLKRPVHDEAFNVGSGTENYQVKELADIVADVVPGAAVTITGETGSDPRSYRVDLTKISERLPAFRPQWNALQGAAEQYGAFSRFGFEPEQHALLFKRLAWLEHAGSRTSWTAPCAGRSCTRDGGSLL